LNPDAAQPSVFCGAFAAETAIPVHWHLASAKAQGIAHSVTDSNGTFEPALFSLAGVFHTTSPAPTSI
jgi:hypothetical protein